jgi:ketosteroid isomerase-like protein
MKKITILLFLHCMVAGLFAQTSNPGRDKIKADIENLNKEMEKVFNADDMAATAAFYSDDAEIIGANYQVSGRKAVDNYWIALKGKGGGWKLKVIEIGGAGDYIYQLGNSELTYIVNGKETKSVTNFVLIWKKQSDGKYKIFRDYLTDIEFKKTK